MQIWIKNQICLSDCPESLRIVLSARLALPYLTWIENERMGQWNGKTPQSLCCFETDPDRSGWQPDHSARIYPVPSAIMLHLGL